MPKPSSSPSGRRALLSVSDKEGLVACATRLEKAGFEILSTGGTEKVLRDAGIEVTGVETVTGFPESFGGRVKTMHPALLGGVLFKRTDKEHVQQAAELGIGNVDMVIVNLYPFRTTIQKLGFTPEPGKALPDAAIEQIDIGGPTLLRSAAKNHESVTVVCDPADYDRVLSEIEKSGDTTMELRRELATKAFHHTATYDSFIAETMSGGDSDDIMLVDGKKLRYGENPHQWGKFCRIFGHPPKQWKQLQGKELSYLNLLDADAAWRMVSEFDHPAAVFVKHANPSGIASSDTIADAFQKAYDADKLSAFGVIIAINRPCSAEVAKKIVDQKIFVEVILAPTFDRDAQTILQTKPNVRVLSMGDTRFSENVLYRSAFGGMLLQNDDLKEVTASELKCVTDRKPTKQEIQDMLFAWKVVKHAKSNAIVLAKNLVTVGIGCGQTSRVDSTWIALKRAQQQAKGSVLASDAFFPFPDALEEAAKAGVSAFIQPGGSVRDEEVFAKANELGVSMVLTGVRAFRH